MFSRDSWGVGIKKHMNMGYAFMWLGKAMETMIYVCVLGKITPFSHQVSKSIIDRYGGKEHLEAPPKELIFASTEEYVEYSRTGKIVKGEGDQIGRHRIIILYMQI